MHSRLSTACGAAAVGTSRQGQRPAPRRHTCTAARTPPPAGCPSCPSAPGLQGEAQQKITKVLLAPLQETAKVCKGVLASVGKLHSQPAAQQPGSGESTHCCLRRDTRRAVACRRRQSQLAALLHSKSTSPSPARWWCVRNSALQLAWICRTCASAAKKAGPTSSPCAHTSTSAAAGSWQQQARRRLEERWCMRGAARGRRPVCRALGISAISTADRTGAGPPHLQGRGLCGRELVLFEEPPHQLAARLAGLHMVEQQGGKAQ